ncbi:hypothetical protein BDR07DRAFT_1449538 [Suillus spraguei]|nr:hypothetical protein BDR07DRAFT_1449538 [Suillus spraguei]
MASNNPVPMASARLPSEFKTEYHPRSGCPTLFQPFDEFCISSEVQHAPIIDKEPRHPFRLHGDFEFSEIAIEAALNKSQINALLSLITRVSEGNAQITLKNEADLFKAWDNAAVELIPFSKHEVSVTYKKNEQVYKVHARPIWDWALNLLDNPLLAPHFVWDMCCVFKHNGTRFERFINELWTADRWWDVQDCFSTPFCFILYADKTKLLSHGTVKGYPVMVQCANLPIHIQNGETFGGGCIVRWLPIVPEDAGEEGKLGYTTLKCVVWHESFFKFLEHAAQYLKTGCMMSLIRGCSGKCPCPVCLVPLAELHDLLKTYPLRSMEEAKEALRVYECSKAQGEELLKALGLRPVENIFWIIWFLDPHDVLSFDRLHSLHGGVWKHLLGELKKILASLGREAEAAFEKLFSIISPSHQSLYACLTILTARTSPEGYQLLRVISMYLQLDSLIGLDVYTEGTLAAIEAKLLVFDRELKDVAMQILRVDHHKYALMLLREHINQVDEYDRLQALGNDLPDEDVAVTFNGHVKLGALTQHPSSILDLENCSSVDRAFQAFQRKYIHEHRYLKVNYELIVDWKQVTDHLRCNPQFHGLPRFDHVLIQLMAEETIFFVLIQPYTARINGACRMDHFFKLTRVKPIPRASSIFVPLSSFI